MKRERKTRRKSNSTTKSTKKESSISITRIPRPNGLTLACIKYRTSDDPPNRKKILKKNIVNNTIQQYIMGGMKLCGETLSIPELANMLQESPLSITKQLIRGEQLLVGKDEAGLKDFGNVLAGLLFNWCMADRALISSQASMLLDEQEGQYKAFVSGEANRALANLLNSQKGMLDLFKAISGHTTTMIQINQQQNLNNDSQSDIQALDVGQAVELLNEHNNNLLLSKDKPQNANLDALNATYSQRDLPEILANNQQGQKMERTGNKVSEYKAKQVEIDNNLSTREKDNPIQDIEAEEIRDV